MTNLEKQTIDLLTERGVSIEEIAELVFFLQAEYISTLTLNDCRSAVLDVLKKREVQHAVLTGISIDKMIEEKRISEPLYSIINQDNGLYGVDEILALGIVNVYGSIGLTNFGYVDKLKPGLIKKIDQAGKEDGVCNTFLDDICGALAAAAASKIAHTTK